jgi:hypothetical protein
LNNPVKHGDEARHLLEESAAVTRAIDQAVRAQLAAKPSASNLEVAQAVTMELLTRIPTQIDPVLKLPGAAVTLWAHIREAREDSVSK